MTELLQVVLFFASGGAWVVWVTSWLDRRPRDHCKPRRDQMATRPKRARLRPSVTRSEAKEMMREMVDSLGVRE